MDVSIRIDGTKEEMADIFALLAGKGTVTIGETLAEQTALLPPGPGAGGDVTPPGQEAGDPAGGVDHSVELDKAYFPWDERINTASKLKLAKEDTWKLIRGIETKSPGLVAQVQAEQRAKGYGVPPTVGGPDGNSGDATPPGPKAVVMDFPQIIAAINSKIQAGEFTDAHADQELQKLGITGGPPFIGTRPDLFPTVIEVLGLC